jgi:hypothetical protein
MMEEQKETVGFSAGTRGSKTKGARVDKKPALSESGTDKNPADRARKDHAMPRDAFEALLTKDQTFCDSRHSGAEPEACKVHLVSHMESNDEHSPKQEPPEGRIAVQRA